MSAPTPSAPRAGPAAAPSAPSPPPPLSGEIREMGASRRDSVRAQRWIAQGGARVTGDVEVETAELSGTVSIRGALRARDFRLAGSLDTAGLVEIGGTFSVEGAATLASGGHTGSFSLRGAGRLGGPLKVDRAASWNGALEAVGNLTAGSVDFEGSVHLTGDLSGTTIVGRLKAPSSVANIRAGTLTLTRPGLLPPFQRGALEVVRIDATEAHLEGVTAEFVKAEKVTLGPGCHVAAVEGRLVSVHPSSHVGPESRSPPPHGLFR